MDSPPVLCRCRRGPYLERPIRVDLELARDGYLYLPALGYHPCIRRRIIGLDRIAGDATVAGVSFWWGRPAGDEAAISYLWTRRVLLSPFITSWENWELRAILSNELGHCALQTHDEERLHRWQMERYGDLIVQEMVA